jgi:hypothetical protein
MLEIYWDSRTTIYFLFSKINLEGIDLLAANHFRFGDQKNLRMSFTEYMADSKPLLSFGWVFCVL